MRVLLLVVTGLCFTLSVYAHKGLVKDQWNVIYIIDGDTFYAVKEGGNRTKFRLIGIDTPESKHPTKPVQPFSKEATKKMTELISEDMVFLEYDVQRKDRYGRTLVYVYNVDGVFINKELVEVGLAQVYTFPPNIKYVEVFKDAQNRARNDRKGMWE